jgi:hypothetical protein
MGGQKDLWIKEQERGWRSFDDKFVCQECFDDYALKRFGSEALAKDVCDSIADRLWCQRNFYELRRDKRLLLDWHRFADVVKHRSRFLFLRDVTDPGRDGHAPHEILDFLGECFKNFGLVKALDPGVTLFRARRHAQNESFATIGQLRSYQSRDDVSSY